MAFRQVIKDKKLFMPTDIVNKWRNHTLVGPTFQKFLDGFLEEFEIVESRAAPVPEEDATKKRGAASETSATAKRARVALDAALVVDATGIDKALLHECRIGSKDPAVWLQIRAQNHIYIVNKGTKDWVASDSFVAGFGRGAFKIIKQDAELPSGAVELHLTSSSDSIHYDGKMQVLGDVIKELRQRNPDTKVTYHKMTFDTQEPHKFELQWTHRVIFVSRPEEQSAQEMKDGNAAARESLQLWQSSNSVGVFWVMKFSQVKGLIPVKPAVYLKGSVTLGPGQALILSKAA